MKTKINRKNVKIKITNDKLCNIEQSLELKSRLLSTSYSVNDILMYELYNYKYVVADYFRGKNHFVID